MPISQKHMVIRYLNTLKGDVGEWAAISTKLSELKEENRDDIKVRIVVEHFKELLPVSQAQAFIVGNTDVVFIFPKKHQDQVRAALIKLRFMFANDPFVANDPNFERFVEWFDFQDKYGEFQDYLEKSYVSLPPKERVLLKSKNEDFKKREIAKEKAKEKYEGKPLTAKLLSRVEHALSSADFSNMIRRQSVCAVVGNSQPYRLFDEIFVDIQNLRATVLPDIDLTINPWLFMHLTETLDERVMSIINSHEDATLVNDFSINLNVSTILSESFITFDDSIKSSMRSSIVFELQLIDIFSDLRSYFLARDIAHDKGYRICIDGVTHDMLPLVDREEVKADLVKIIWSDKLADILANDPEAIQTDINRIGANSIIMCRVDDQYGLDVGRSLGITMYQGYHIQRCIGEDVRNRRIGTVMVNQLYRKKSSDG
ncbi:MAG: EAL domain-containing protein [Alphaproteobacteria bacterium]|nr:EAL domain-containing protein [Alphaproteobacteria bacterium]